MKKTKPKYKGTRYVAKVLKKYFKKKYPTYNSALPKAREINDLLKKSGQKLTVKNVSELIRKKRGPKQQKKTAPELFYKLKTPLYYFDLVDYPTYINDTTSEIHFVSKLFNEPDYEIQGGQRQPYSNLFSSYVNYVNSIIDDDSDDYANEYMVMATEPVYNNQNKRWESEIISTDKSGQQKDYGFDSGQPPVSSIATQQKSTIRSQKIQERKEEKIQKSQQTIQKELDLKLSKEKSRQLAMELFLKNKISKLEYKRMIDDINRM
jgi:hypothetical protein